MANPQLHDRLAAALTSCRTNAGLTQRALAAKMNTNQTQIALIETGDQFVRVETLVEWAQACGADPLTLLASALSV